MGKTRGKNLVLGGWMSRAVSQTVLAEAGVAGTFLGPGRPAHRLHTTASTRALCFCKYTLLDYLASSCAFLRDAGILEVPHPKKQQIRQTTTTPTKPCPADNLTNTTIA